NCGGNGIPSDLELKSRLTHAPPRERDGNSAARACRTRASASVVRKVASATTGTSPDASRTASANDRRSGGGGGAVGAGACAARGARGAPMATSRSEERRVGKEGRSRWAPYQ